MSLEDSSINELNMIWRDLKTNTTVTDFKDTKETEKFTRKIIHIRKFDIMEVIDSVPISVEIDFS